MGVQCSIILTYNSGRNQDEIDKQIRHFIGMPEDERSHIEAMGDRNWGPTDLNTEVICMRDWFEAECQIFFLFLKSLEWENKETVQIYYCPASYHSDGYELFRYVKLFETK
jgi:hypothetical protein